MQPAPGAPPAAHCAWYCVVPALVLALFASAQLVTWGAGCNCAAQQASNKCTTRVVYILLHPVIAYKCSCSFKVRYMY